MAINKTMKRVLKALSYNGIDVEASRSLANLKAIDPMRIFHTKLNFKVADGGREVPVRIFFPDGEVPTLRSAKEQTEHALRTGDRAGYDHSGADQTAYTQQETKSVGINLPTLLFLHGGGWVTERIDNYERVCARMAQATNHIVIAVEYRLAPEHPFPAGLMDCYAVAKAVYTDRFLLNINPEHVTLIGDSAGGNLAAALSLMARDKGEFLPKRQILIYPALASDYSEYSPFPSVRENGSDYLLTAGKMRDYINLYARNEEDKKNPYFAPILADDLTRQPDTLVISAEFDPLRDEGEAYGRRLAEAGNRVEMHRIKDALHGYFALGIKYLHVQESFAIINNFLRG